MIITLKKNAPKHDVDKLIHKFEGMNLQVTMIQGDNYNVFGLVGDTSIVDEKSVMANPIVYNVQRVAQPYKLANRMFHPEDTIVDVNGIQIGGKKIAMIAGPCSVEGEDQICRIAKEVKAAGADMLRGGAYKPRTSPYAFQGMGTAGIMAMVKARQETGLPIVTEIMRASHIDMFENVDIIQVGARNMQNFELLKEVGKMSKPILLKRGLANTIDELLMSAEYIMASGNENVILCERGIRTFETRTRNTLDLSAVPVLKKLTHLPIVVDPSHAMGYAHLVKPMAMAATVAGADGLMIEVHNNPAKALCDGPQSLTPDQFDDVAKQVFQLRPFACKYDY